MQIEAKSRVGICMLGKVHEMILNSSIVVADVTEYSPNVYYEYGYASAHDRTPESEIKKVMNVVNYYKEKYRDTPEKLIPKSMEDRPMSVEEWFNEALKKFFDGEEESIQHILSR